MFYSFQNYIRLEFKTFLCNIICHFYKNNPKLLKAMKPDDTPGKSFVIPKKARSVAQQFTSKLEKGTRDWDNIAGILKHSCRVTRNIDR